MNLAPSTRWASADRGDLLEVLRAHADDDLVPVQRVGIVCYRLRHLVVAHREPHVRALDLRREEVHRRRPDEPGDEQVGGREVQLFRRRDLLHHSSAHDRDAVPQRHRLGLVVGDVHRRDPEVVLELRELVAGLHPQFGVEVRQWLVEEERGRLAHDGASHRDPLALTAGEVGGLAVEELIELQDLRRVAHPPFDLLLAELGQLQRERHVLPDGEVRIERVVLEDHREVPFARRLAGHHLVADADVARR